MKASRLFSEEDKKRISDAVAEAERRTSAEIVPVVAASSGRYDRAEDVFGVLTALAVVTAAWLLLQGVAAGGEWAAVPRLRLGLPWVLLLFVGGFALGSWLATRLPVLKLPFVPRTEMEEEVERGARAAFQRFRLRGAAGAGVLVYVSLLERRVRVLGDDDVAGRIGAEQWEEACGLLLEALRGGRPADGIVAATGRLGELLSEPYPLSTEAGGYLPNELRIIDEP